MTPNMVESLFLANDKLNDSVIVSYGDIVFETVESLNMRIPKLYIGNVRRDEIQFEINPFSYSGSHEEEKIKHTKNKIENNIISSTKTICYFPWTRQIEATNLMLSKDNQEFVGKYCTQKIHSTCNALTDVRRPLDN